jgi:hypothetical protein
MVQWTMVRRFLTLALAAALTACSEPTSPNPSATGLTLLPEVTKPALVQCPTDISLSTSVLIVSGDEEVSVGGHRIIFPPGALPLGSLVTLTAPAGKYVEIHASVNGLPDFKFDNQLVTVVIDYSRCSRANIDRAPLRVWYIDTLTKAFIADMGGVDDKTARTVTFTTDHFSGYAVAQ